MRLIPVFIVLLISAINYSLYAQTKVIEKPGVVKGTIRDSIHNHALKSATIAIYKEPKKELLAYLVSNNLGEFSVRNLPVSIPLEIIISNIGYKQYSKIFEIPDSSAVMDFKTLFISINEIEIEEVTITIPPIQMNGDTLEFNAAAFKLDSNAVVQDLLKNIPNITQWGDGTITVNGREIKKLLVNGKEFMGGDTKVSIENIPKNALEKIQVYNTLQDSKNIQDSILHMNLKLKKGKETGFFGKIGAGRGTSGSYEADGNLNFFSPKLQLSLVAASNNINKIPNDINTLLRNSTYKGVGVQLDYMPNFKVAGTNKPTSAGYKLEYELTDIVNRRNNKNLISNEYFFKDNQTFQGSNIKIITSISGGEDTNIVEEVLTKNNSHTDNHKFDLGYVYAKDRYSFVLSQHINANNNISSNNRVNSSSNSNSELISNSYVSTNSKASNTSYNFKSGFNYLSNIWDVNRRFSGFSSNYAIQLTRNRDDRENMTNFQSFRDTLKSRDFNRQYNNSSNTFNQNINFKLNNLLRLVFGANNFSIFDIDVDNNLRINHSSHTAIAYDYNTASKGYTTNDHLTNNSFYIATIYEPELIMHKIITRRLTNRFHQSWSFVFNIKSQFFRQKNRSEKDFQNINRLYSNFLPAARLEFSDSQYGNYRKVFSMNYNNTIIAPSITQLAPLIDSINVYYFRVGNFDLQEQREESINVKFHYSSEKKDNFEYEIVGRYATVHDNMVDKVTIDQQNLRTVYAINNSENYEYGISGWVRKSLKLKHSELQFRYNAHYNYSKTPNFINDHESFWYNNDIENVVNIHFTIRSNVAVEAKQNLINSFSKESKGERKWTNMHASTSLSMSYNLTNKLTINSNLSFSKNTASKTDAIHYNLWNVSAFYRLLKGNNLELSFSALDLLRQNNAIIYHNQAGRITTGTQNVLKQYFILGISYYPRKFGR